MANQIDTDSKIISADQFGFGQPVLCRCSSTLMFAAHINNSSQLEIHKSINNGSSWTLVKTFTETNPGDFEMAAIDSTSAAIIFIYNTYSNQLYVTTDSGSTWTSKYTIGAGTACIKANIAYDPLENRLWAAYKFTTEIRLAYSDNKGTSWSYVDSTTINGQIHDIDISPSNSKVYVIIAPSTYTSNGARYIFSKLGVYESNASMSRGLRSGCMIIDSAGNDWVITVRNSVTDGKWRIGYSLNGAAMSDSNTLLAENNEVDLIVKGSLSCAVDGDDNIYAFYTKASDEKCYYRKYNGSTWESEVELVGVANDRISTEKRPISASNKLHYVYYKAP